MNEAWNDDAASVAAYWQSDLDRGLTQSEAHRRLESHGSNEFDAGEHRSVWLLLARQFTNTMILVLAVAAVVTIAIGDKTDAIVILVIVVLNATVGFVQEFRAERAMEALNRLTTVVARIVRDGVPVEIPTNDLVPGDLVRLTAGDVVPADIRLSDVQALRVDEAPLTGESESVAKMTRSMGAGGVTMVGDRINMAFRGTSVSSGRGAGIVVATGMQTEMGRIAGMLQGHGHSATPLQRQLASLGRRLAGVALVVCGIVFLAGTASGEPVNEMFLIAVSLAVAAIPEGLPAVVTVALALGARRMADRRALVRRLPAVETLGSITVVCTDKTGTLTQGRMAVEQIWTPRASYTVQGSGYDPAGTITSDSDGDDPYLDRIARVGAACNDAELQPPDDDGAWTLIGDPTEGAIRAMAARLGVAVHEQSDRWPRVFEIAFTSDRKRMTTVHPDGHRHWVATKGALEAVGPLLHDDDGSHLQRAHEAAAALAADGYRVLAFADRYIDGPSPDTESQTERDLHLIGLVGIADPPRPGVDDAVSRCHQAGIRPIMITGDHPATAVAIARRVHFLDDRQRNVLTGPELAELDDDQLVEQVDNFQVYARTSPDQKLRIVNAWRRRGAIVAMTGDGVNDAPALLRADIGVAMGITGTDVSREAADMVLADDNFATIVNAVEEGRRIYDNIRRFVRYMLTTNSGEILVMVVAPFVGLPVPLTAAQILWINLVTDGLPAVALGLEPAEADTMQRPPRSPRESILGRGLWQHAIWVGGLMAAVAVAMQAITRSIDWPWPTMVFTTVAFLQLGHALAVRSERSSIFSLGLRSNSWLTAAIGTSLLLQTATIYVPPLNDAFDTEPLSPVQLLVAALASTAALVAVEVEKWLRRSRQETAHPD